MFEGCVGCCGVTYWVLMELNTLKRYVTYLPWFGREAASKSAFITTQ
jgi:hypothetical protein